MFKHKLATYTLVMGLLIGAGCTVTQLNADGTRQVVEPDYALIQLSATASVAAWAATQRDGINRDDATAVVSILNVIEEFHADGSLLEPAKWTVVIQQQLKPRYQALAVVMVSLVAHELDKYGVAMKVPAADNTAGKIIKAVRDGVLLGLSPYLGDRKA